MTKLTQILTFHIWGLLNVKSFVQYTYCHCTVFWEIHKSPHESNVLKCTLM